MKNKVLITGALGLTGRACMELFEAKGWYVLGIDNNQRSAMFGTASQASPHNVLNIDIRDIGGITNLFSTHVFDAIIHAAAQPSHDYATLHVMEDFDINARGTVLLLEATRKYCPEAVFVHVSTDKVYGENMALKVKETDTRFSPFSDENSFGEKIGLDFAGDRSFFGCSKTAADVYAQQYGMRGMKIGIFRPGCITGKNHQGAEQHGFLAYLAKCIKEGKTYKIFGFKGKQVRDQIHADDIASAFYAFVEKPTPQGVYNIGGGITRSVSILEAGELLSKELGKTFMYEFHKERPGDRIWDVHDISKFRKDYLNWEYQYSLQDIIKDICI